MNSVREATVKLLRFRFKEMRRKYRYDVAYYALRIRADKLIGGSFGNTR